MIGRVKQPILSYKHYLCYLIAHTQKFTDDVKLLHWHDWVYFGWYCAFRCNFLYLMMVFCPSSSRCGWMQEPRSSSLTPSVWVALPHWGATTNITTTATGEIWYESVQHQLFSINCMSLPYPSGLLITISWREAHLCSRQCHDIFSKWSGSS